MQYTRLFSFSLALLLSQFTWADSPKRLVTVSGTLDPKFSIEVSPSEMDRLLRQINAGAELPPASIDINDLMEPSDELAIQAAANSIAAKFVSASQSLIDLHAITYRMDALSQALDKDTFKTVAKPYRQKYAAQYSEMVSGLLLIDRAMIEAISACHSELCVANIQKAQVEMLDFAYAVNKGKSYTPPKGKSLLKASLEDTYRQMGNGAASAEKNAYATSVHRALSTFVATSRGSHKFQEGFHSVVSSAESIKHLKLKPYVLPKRVLKSELGWLKSIVKAKMKAVVLGLQFKVPTHYDYYRTHILVCTNYFWWHGAFYGEFNDKAVTGGGQCSTVRGGMGAVDATFRTFGPGLAVTAESFLVVITSPTPIPLHGTWAGPSIGLGLLLGANAGVMLGPKVSLATILGAQFGALTAFAGIETMTLK